MKAFNTSYSLWSSIRNFALTGISVLGVLSARADVVLHGSLSGSSSLPKAGLLAKSSPLVLPVLSDGELILYSNSVTDSTGGSSILAGRANDGGLSLAYFIFQLPSVASLGGTVFGSADFNVGFLGTGTRKSDATLRLINQTFASTSEIGISAPNDGLLKTRVRVDASFIPMADAGGASAVASSNDPLLLSSLNNLYAGGAGAGRYVVFDVSYIGSFPTYPGDLDPVTNEAGFLFDSTSTFAPYSDHPAQLELSAIPEPMSGVLALGAGGLLLGLRRKEHF